MISFEYLNKSDFSAFARQIFDILADNMTVIAPTGNTREDDYNCWNECITDSLKSDERHIVLIKDKGTLIGFFQYNINADTFMMEEIQFRPEYQGKGVFRKLYGFVVSQIKGNVEFIEAYASVSNSKSIGILENFGLLNVGLNKNERSYHFKGSYADFLKWYHAGETL